MSRYGILFLVLLQGLCAVVFLWNILSSVFGLPPINWSAQEAIELGAAFGLILGSVLGGIALRRGQRRSARIESQLRAASGAFMALLEWNTIKLKHSRRGGGSLRIPLG